MGKTVRFASSFAYNDEESVNNNNNNNNDGKVNSNEEKEADVNIICLKLGEISEQAGEPITGDPLFCSNEKCKAVFNSTSESKDQTWKCEFCQHTTEVHLEKEEIPQNTEVDYILEPVKKTSTESDDTSMIVFCIDTSGSMCVTSEVETSEPVKMKDAKDLDKFVERGASQRLPNQKKNVQYISRLQSVQTAVASQIEALHKNFPKRRLGIVTFSDDIQILGDGTKEPVTIAGDKLDHYDELVEIGSKFEMDTGVEKTKNQLLQKLKGLEEQGGTALGPALLVSCAIASKKSGSKIIICTDGLANIGLGAMDEPNKVAVSFYDQVAAYAKEMGVVVSVCTIAGNECLLENIGKVADITGGEVNIVDPAKISSQFAAILEKPVIATNVTATLVAHQAIKFSNGTSLIKKDVGNITADSEITFDFSVDPKHAAGLTSAPFQVQIVYRRTDGPLCVRVITTSQPLTSDRSLAEQDVDVLLIGVHVSKTSASLVQEGKYKAARANALANKKMLQRAVHTREQQELLTQFDRTLNVAETELEHTTKYESEQGVALEDDYDLTEDAAYMRSQARGDRTAAYMYQMKGSSTKEANACVVQ